MKKFCLHGKRLHVIWIGCDGTNQLSSFLHPEHQLFLHLPYSNGTDCKRLALVAGKFVNKIAAFFFLLISVLFFLALLLPCNSLSILSFSLHSSQQNGGMSRKEV